LTRAALVLVDGLSPGSGRPRTPRRRTRWWTSPAGRCCRLGGQPHAPGVRRRPDRRVRRADGGEPYRAGGIAVTVEATRAATDEQLTATCAGRGEAAPRHHVPGDEDRLRLTVADEARAARLAAAEVDEVTFLGAHLVPPGADADEYVELVCGPMLEAVARTCAGPTCSARPGRSTPTSPAPCSPPPPSTGWAAGARQPARPRPRGGTRRRAGRRQRRPLHVPDRRRRGCAGRLGHGGTLLPACDLSTRQPLRTPARCWTPEHRGAASNCNPGSSYTRRWRSAWPRPCCRCG